MARLSKKKVRPQRARYVMNTTEKKARKKKLKHKETRKTQCSSLQQEWDTKRTVKQNLSEMGLVYDLNRVSQSKKDASTSKCGSTNDVDVKPDKRLRVLEGLKIEKETAESSQKPFRISQPELLYCVRLIEQYQDDYEAMARDRLNHYQDTPNQIKRKIARFMNTPQYKGYLLAKAENRQILLS